MRIGALWLKKLNRNGKDITYMGGKIQFPGTEMYFSVFKNEKKEKPNQPDYHIEWYAPKEKDNGGSTPDTPADDGVPF